MHFLLPPLLILGPWLMMTLEKSLKPLKWTGTVVNCYLWGLGLAHLPGAAHHPLGNTLAEVSVLLAIPLLLLPTDFMGWLKLARSTVISFALVCVSVCLVAFVVGKTFAHIDPEAWKAAGMLVGVYTGGTANLTAIGKALEVKHETFLIVNTADMVLGGIFLLVLMTVGLKLLTWWLKPFDATGLPDEAHSPWHEAEERWKSAQLPQRLRFLAWCFLLAILAAGVGVGVSRLLWGSLQPATIILTLSVVAVAMSFNSKLRQTVGASEAGHYLLLCFCGIIGSLAHIQQIIASAQGPWLWFTALIMVGSMAVHFVSCKIFGIDRDTALITSVAGIYGPAFIAPFADLLKNRWLLVSGITTGLVGFAVGNFLGLAVAYALKP